ncbi:MAG: hypothetical protein V2I43_19335, partial [Parvularcula sp.]|nr:hypothetical protein [Parvularcula sp.]
ADGGIEAPRSQPAIAAPIVGHGKTIAERHCLDRTEGLIGMAARNGFPGRSAARRLGLDQRDAVGASVLF